MKQIKFIYYNGSKQNKIIMSIPKHERLIKITAGGEGEEHRYWYADSALIYLSDLNGSITINEPLILKQEGAYSKRFEKDSISFEGVNESGNFWREIKYKGLFFGYSNVPPTKKQFFDSALSSARSK